MNFIKIHPDDNVIVAIEDIKKGSTIEIDGDVINACDDIPGGHKMAAADIKKGNDVIKYGFPIGTAKNDISKGEWIHTHNTATKLDGELEYTYNPVPTTPVITGEDITFDGYVRDDGSVGIRNEIWIIVTVGCVNQTAEILKKEAQIRFGSRANIEGFQALTHPYGCSQMGEDHKTTQKMLAGLAAHPNAGGVLVLGLGCENNYIDVFKEVLGNYNPDRIKFLNTQDVEDEIEEGLNILDGLTQYVSEFERKPVPISKLKVGLKCGGSDGYSGITANPLLGAFSDLLTGLNGITMLTEVPEMFGAETILMNHCSDEETYLKTVNLINGFKQYFLDHNQVVYENPSPGNKKGGITTLEDKSLGCTQKGGQSAVVDVIDYGDSVTKHGLNLLRGPGNDMVAITVMASSGAHMILFTTGRGNPLGSVVPTLKVSTNTALAVKKPHWIDFNAGVLVEGKTMMDIKGEFFNFIVDVASGKKVRNEINGYREITLFKSGVTV